MARIETHGTITADDLMAYADRQLDPSRHAAVEAHLREHPQARALVEGWRGQNDGLGAILDPVLEEPVPPRILRAAEGRSPWARASRIATAAVVVLAIGLGGGWTLGERQSNAAHAGADLGERALLAHRVFASGPAPLLDLASADAAEVGEWLGARMGGRVDVPRLEDLGFALLGARMMMGETDPAGLLVYERADGPRLVVFVRDDVEPSRRDEPGVARRPGLGAVHWTHEGHGIGVAGSLPEDELRAVAGAIEARIPT